MFADLAKEFRSLSPREQEVRVRRFTKWPASRQFGRVLTETESIEACHEDADFLALLKDGLILFASSPVGPIPFRVPDVMLRLNSSKWFPVPPAGKEE